MAVLYEKKGHIATITLNRPNVLNAIDPETSVELAQAWTDFRDDPVLRVAILTGSGERAFSAGADLKALGGGSLAKDRGVAFGGNTQGMEIMKPMIAAINGLALGGGLEIALTCDLRIAVEHAVFGLPEARSGLIPAGGGLIRLPRVLPLAKALEMILMSRQLDASEALQYGLVNKVVPLPDLMQTALDWANRICDLAPLALQASKECLYTSLDMGLEEALKLDDVLLERLLPTEDAREGMNAFIEKRKPVFRGK